MADIKYTVTVDAKGAASEVKKFDNAVDGLGKTTPKTSSALSGLWKEFAKGMLAGASVAAVIHGLSKAMRTIPAAFLDAAVVTENYTVRLETLLGSQKAAADAMSYFQEVAAGVPFTLEAVIDAGTKVTAFGLEFRKWTPIVADLAAVMGLSLPEAASALGRAFAGGAGAADIFRERGILNIIKDSALMKRGIDDLSKVSLPEFRDIMYETFTDQGGKIAGGADKLAKTWSGTISMIQDKWFQMRQKVMEAGIFDTLKEQLESLNKKLQEFVDSGQLEEWANRAAKGFDVLVRSIEELHLLAEASAKGTGPAGVWADKITGGSRKMAEAVAAARRTVLEFRDSLEYAKPPMNEMREAMELGEASWKAYTEAVRWHDAQMKRYADVEKQMADAAKKAAADINRVGRAAEETARKMAKLEKATVDVKGAFDGLAGANLDLLMLGFQDVGEAAEGATSILQSFVDDALKDQVIPEIENMSSVWDSTMLAMTAGLVSFGDANASIWSNVSAVFGNFIKSAISGMEAMYLKQLLISKGIIKAKQGEATASHIGNIFRAVPFPFDLILAAGAFAVVNALFSKLLKFEKGGVFKKPTIAEIGHGTEYVLPEAKLVNLIRAAVSGRPVGSAPAPTMAMAGVGGTTVNLYGPLLSVRELSDSNIRAAGDKLYAEVNRQARRLGRE